MRVSLKHLLLGMSLGAVVVLFYGYIKFHNLQESKIKISQDKSYLEYKNKSVKDLIEPQIANLLDSSTEQSKFPEFSKLYSIKLIAYNKITQSSENSSNKFVNNNDSINKIIEPKISSYMKIETYKQSEFFIIKNLLSPKDVEINRPSPTQTLIPTPSLTQYKSKSNDIVNIIEKSKLFLEAPQDIISYIEKYAQEYGVNKDMMIGIAKCESDFRADAVNGPYAGIYQFVSGTWISNRRAMGLDENLELRFNAEEAVKTAAFKMGRDGFGAWPVCQHKAKGYLAYNH